MAGIQHEDIDHTGITGAGGIQASLVTVKGDLIAATGSGAVDNLTVGANDTILMADSGQTTGLKWVAAGTPSDQDYDDVAAVGTADTFARGDHLHGMPSAGGAFDEDLLPWTIDVLAGYGGIANTNWSTFVDQAGGGETYLNGVLQSSGAQNAEVAWDIVLAAGTWDFVMRHYTEANRGIYTLEFDGASQGTMDGYAGTPGSLTALSSVTGITVATSAKIRVSLAMLTKNASSSSYYGAISGFQMRRTA